MAHMNNYRERENPPLLWDATDPWVPGDIGSLAGEKEGVFLLFYPTMVDAIAAAEQDT
jgi:hypothetical protein